MLILSFEEFNNEFGIDNKPMSKIRIEDIGRVISLIPKEIVMRDQTPLTIKNDDFNIIVILHPADVNYWILVIRRRGGEVYYFDSFGVETTPFFLEEYMIWALMKEHGNIMNLFVGLIVCI